MVSFTHLNFTLWGPFFQPLTPSLPPGSSPHADLVPPWGSGGGTGLPRTRPHSVTPS